MSSLNEYQRWPPLRSLIYFDAMEELRAEGPIFGTYLAPTAYLPMNPCTEPSSRLSWSTQRLVYDALEKIHVHTDFDHGPWDLYAPSRLIYPEHTDFRKRRNGDR